MARTLSATMLAEIGRETGETVYLLEMQFSGGTVRLTTGAKDISWNSQTWQAFGGLLTVQPVGETPDDRAQGVDVELSGVDLTIMALILGQNYRGRLAKIYYAHLDRGSNLCLRSEDLLHAAWARVGITGITANSGADERGRFILDRVVEDTANSAHLIRETMTIPAGARLWASAVIRPGGRWNGMFYCDNAAFTSRAGIDFDLNGGTTGPTTTGSGVVDAHGLDDLGGGLYRVWFLGQVDGASTSVLTTVRLRDGAGATSYLGDGVSGFHAGKVQVAVGAAEIPYAVAVDVTRVDGQVTPTPIEIFTGYMNEGFEVVEERSPEGNTTARISTRFTSRMAGFSKIRGIITNLDSHQAVYLGDTFFQHVAGIAGQQIIWGRATTVGERYRDALGSGTMGYPRRYG